MIEKLVCTKDFEYIGGSYEANGVFSYIRKMSKGTISFEDKKVKVIAQDLAGDLPVDISRKVRIQGNRLIIPGKIIRKIGLMNATPGDLSAPGMVIKMM